MLLSNRGARRARRWLSGFTALVLVLSMVGPTMPVLAYAEEPVAAAEAPAPEPVVEAPPSPDRAPAAEPPAPEAAPEPPAADVVEPPAAPAVEAPSPADRTAPDPVASQENQPVTVPAEAPAPEVSSLAAPVTAAAVTVAGGAFSLSLEGYNLAMGKWTTGNLGKKYREGDEIQFRVILDNTGQTTDYVVPAFSLRYPYYRSQDNAIGCDYTGSYGTVVVSKVADGDDRFPTTTPLAPNTLDGAYPPGAAQPSQFHASYYDAGRITVPAGKIVVLYWEAHLARTDYWNAQSPAREGSSFYPGSSSHFDLEMVGVGDKTVPWPQIQPLGAAKIVVHKFNDLNGNGDYDDGEPPLSGWTFTLTGPHGVNLSKTTGATGTVEFGALDGVEPGTNHEYVLDEVGGHGPVWYQTTSLPITIPFGTDDGSAVEWVGNREKVTKTFRLTAYSVVKTATFRADYYEGGVKAGSVDLLQVAPSTYEATAGVMAVTEFSSVKWYAIYGGEDLLLGTTGPEVISDDKLNTFTYENQVCGAKVNDLDGDGDASDTGEPFMSGWTINLYRGTELWDTTTTDAEGKYYFVNLLPGTYHVEEVLKAGWAQTRKPAEFTIPRASTECPPLKFFNHVIPTGKITVTKFNDLNGDGNQDAGEGPLAGWTFTATGPFGYSQSKTTTESGSVVFDGLEPGAYAVSETAQPGWVGTTPGTVNLTLASGGTADVSFGNRELVTKTFRLNFTGAPAGAAMWVSFATASGTTTLALSPKGSGSFEATAGIFAVTEITGVDWMATFEGADYLLGHTGAETISADKLNEFTYNNSIGGTKYNDLNGNGAVDAGEPALAGWTINLYRAQDFDLFDSVAAAAPMPLVATTVTDASGHYSFANLLPGMYAVHEVQQTGWTMTHEPGTNVLVADDTAATGLDFLNRELVTKTFRLSFTGAPAGASMWVKYTTASSTTTLALSPAASGSWEATAGIYAITEITGVDWMATVGGVDYLLGHQGAETISADMLNQFTYNNSIAGVKFRDDNRNGSRDTTETGLGGWTINLYRSTAGGAGASAGVTPTVPAGFALVGSTLTAADGSFSFANLLPGTYMLSETAKGGWVRTVGGGASLVVADDTALTGLVFGNVEEFLTFTAPDLAIEKSVTPTTAKAGSLLTYTLVYKNTGDAAATDFVITDTFDATRVDVVNPSGGTVSGNTIVWHLSGPLAPGASGTITYTMRVKATLPAGTTVIDNRVVITLPGLTESTPQDNESAAKVTITEGFLPFTSGEAWLLMLAALALALVGVALMRSARNG